jgi:hypothetical protein
VTGARSVGIILQNGSYVTPSGGHGARAGIQYHENVRQIRPSLVPRCAERKAAA